MSFVNDFRLRGKKKGVVMNKSWKGSFIYQISWLIKLWSDDGDEEG